MSNENKVSLFCELLHHRQKLTWIAQRSRESVDSYIQRVCCTYRSYDYTAQLIRSELYEIFLNKSQREKEAIYCLLQGLSKTVKRYMCEPQYYTNLNQAVSHAIKVEKTLLNISNLSRASFTIDTL